MNALERRLLEEVLEIKDQQGHVLVAVERLNNAIAQQQMISSAETARHSKEISDLKTWKEEIEKERAEQRGAARVRKSLLAVIAGGASLFGGGIVALINYLLRGAP